MSTTFTAMKTVAPPQSITHAVAGQLFGSSGNSTQSPQPQHQQQQQQQLIVLRGNYLEIYQFNQPTTTATIQDTNRVLGQTDVNDARLERVFQSPLYGEVEGVASVRLPGWSRDVLLFTFPQSKLSVCAWDIGRHDLVTLCIWSQDEEVIEKERERLAQLNTQLPPPTSKSLASITQVKKYIQPILRVDPSNRCAVLATFDAYLNIFDLSIPNPQPHALAATPITQLPPCQSGIATSSTGSTSYYAHASATFSTFEGVGTIPSLASPNTYSLAAMGIGAITDMQFLYGFEDPTLLILHERHRTWEGRYAASRLSQELSCITFHLKQNSFSLIGSIKNVAHDAFAIHPIPMPLGGALILQQNLIAHWNNNSLDYALTVNGYGAATAQTDKMAHMDASNHTTKLDRSRLTFLSVHIDRAIAMLVTSDGISYLLHIYPSGANIRQMQLEALGMMCVPEGLIRIAHPNSARAILSSQPSTNPHNLSASYLPSYIFAFSRLGPGLLLEYRRAQDEDKRQQAEEEAEEQQAEANERKQQIEAKEAKQRLEAEKQAAKTEPTGSPTIKTEPSAADQNGTDVPSGTTPAPTVPIPTPASESDDVTDGERPAKRSKLDDLYKELTGENMVEDELMDVFGFGRAGETAKEEQQEKEAKIASAPPEDTDKAAESVLALALAQQEEARLEKLQRAFRQKKEWLFFVRDRLTCYAPATDLTFSYTIPKSEEERRELEEADDILEDEQRKRLFEKEELKASGAKTEEQQKAQKEKDQAAQAELEKKWREKERKSRLLEIIQSSGLKEAGSIVISNEGLLPDVISATPLQRKCVGCWTLRQTQTNQTGHIDEIHHSILLISTPSTTLVIQTGLELQELTSDHPFATEQTITAGNVYAINSTNTSDLEGIVQVNPFGLRLIQDGVVIQKFVVPNDPTQSNLLEPFKIVSAQIQSPYILLCLNDHTLRLLTITQTNGKLSFNQDWKPLLDNGLQVTAAHIFKDTTRTRLMKTVASEHENSATNHTNGAVGMELDEDEAALLSNSTPAAVTQPTVASSTVDEMDDLERLLGGDDVTPVAASTPLPASSATATRSTAAPIPAPPAPALPILPPDYVLVVARGINVDFFRLPSLELIYTIERLPIGKRILTDSAKSRPQPVDSDASLNCPIDEGDLPAIVDISLETLSAPGTTSSISDSPYLFAFLANGDLVTYQSFIAFGPRQLKWLRVDTAAANLMRPFLNTNSTLTMSNNNKSYRDAYGVAGHLTPNGPTRFHKLASLGGLMGGKTGLLVTGTKPFFFSLERGTLRAHPFIIDFRPRADDSTTLGGGSQLEEEEDVENEEPQDEAEELSPSSKRKIGLVAVTPFHNPNCEFGLIYFDTHGTLSMAQLPRPNKLPYHPFFMTERKMKKLGLISPIAAGIGSHHAALSPSIGVQPGELYDYDGSLITRTVHLGATPCFIARHIPTSTMVVVVSYPQRIPSVELETDQTLPQYRNKYELLVFSSSWEILSRYADFEPNEMVLCMTPIRMNKKIYIVLGTSDYQNEDHASRGRIIWFDLFFGFGNSLQVDENGQQTQVKQLKQKVYTQAEKLPVNALCQLGSDVLVTGQGSRIILYRHSGKNILDGCAFFDGQIYITSLSTINNFIMYGDMQRGCHLLYYDPILQTLTQLGQSHEHFHTLSTEFMVDHKNLNMVVADEQGNVQIFKFTPNTPSAAANKVQMASYENPHVAHSAGSSQTLRESAFTGTSLLGGLGYRLNLKNDFYLGERVSKMIKMKLRTRLTPNTLIEHQRTLARTNTGMTNGVSSPNKLLRSVSSQLNQSMTARPIQSYVFLASYSGSYAQLLPVDPLVFRRLSTLVVQMTLAIKQIGGLNPLAYRLFHASGPHHPHFAKKLIDCTLLFQFPLLDMDDQWTLATHIGTTPAQIIDNLKWIVWETQLH